MISNIRFVLIILSLFTFIGCEKTFQYDPSIEDVQDLSSEFTKINRAVSDDIYFLNTTLDEDDFSQNYDHFFQTWPNIEVLISKGEKLGSSIKNPSGEYTKYSKLMAELNDAKSVWTNYADDIRNVKMSGVTLLISFNHILNFILNPVFSQAQIDNVGVEYGRLLRNKDVKSLNLIGGREDFDYIMSYGKNVRSIWKVYDFARVTSSAVFQRTNELELEWYLDSLQIVRSELDGAVDNRDLYDKYLKNKVSFTLSGDVYDFDYLLLFNNRSRDIYKLLTSYKSIRGNYIFFKENYNNYVLADIDYTDDLERIAGVLEPSSLFQSIYYPAYSDFKNIIFFAASNSIVVNWKKSYLEFSNNLDLAFEKYEAYDTISTTEDVAEITTLKSDFDHLYEVYGANEAPFDQIFNAEIYEVLQGSLAYKLEMLLLKTN